MKRKYEHREERENINFFSAELLIYISVGRIHICYSYRPGSKLGRPTTAVAVCMSSFLDRIS